MIEFSRAARAAHVSSIFAALPDDVAVSFEFFPPKPQSGLGQLRETARRLAPLDPTFVSVTYGAGGTTHEGSLEAVRMLTAETSLQVAGHLTCVGATKTEVDAVARAYLDAGVTHIVALRGDGGRPGTPFVPHPEGYRNAADLVAGLTRIGPFDISVAAYPEGHPDSASPEADIDNLRRKLDAGASRALTQFFFAPETFFRFRDRAAAAGITQPLVPGILPISNFAQTRRFAEACGAAIPQSMERLFAGLDEQPETRQLVASAFAADFCSRLYAGGVRDFHFYTLNRADLTQALCRLLGKHAAPHFEQAA